MTLAELNQAIATGDVSIEDVTADMVATLTVDFEAQRAFVRNTCKACNGAGKVGQRIPEVQRDARGLMYFTGNTVWSDVTCKSCAGTGKGYRQVVAS